MKPTQCLQKTLRRLPLSTKQAGREYYKGNRVGSMGTLDKYGRFHPDYSKIRTFVYPAKGTKNFEVWGCGTNLPQHQTNNRVADSIRLAPYIREHADKLGGVGACAGADDRRGLSAEVEGGGWA